MRLDRLTALLGAAVLAAALGPAPVAAQAEHRWRVAVVTPAGHPYNLGLEAFERRVEEGSGGRIEITVFPSSQLGGEVESAKNLQLGTLEMTIVSTSNAAPFLKRLEVFGLPYLFRSLPCAYAVLDGEVGEEMAEALREAAGMRVLGWYTFGMRQLFNTRHPILAPADMAGLLFRVPADQIAEAAYRALGASPVPMDFPEVFGALQQGVIHGADNPLITLHQFKWYEVVKFASISNTAAGISPMLVSEAAFRKLDPDLQALVLEAGRASTAINREAEAAATAAARAALEAAGVRIDEVDTAAFRAGVEPVFEKARKDLGAALLERIAAAQSGC